jgi:hypothetical protein
MDHTRPETDSTSRNVSATPDAATFPIESLGWAAAWAELTNGYVIRYGNDRFALLKVVRPGGAAASYVIRWEPQGVLMAEDTNGWLRDSFFPSLQAALLSIYRLSDPQLAEADRRAAYWVAQSDRPGRWAGILRDVWTD